MAATRCPGGGDGPGGQILPKLKEDGQGGSKNLTWGLTGRLTCVEIPAVVRSEAGEACELFSVEKEKGRTGECRV
jgi:hypothetical protein